MTTGTERRDARANKLRIIGAARQVFAEKGVAAEMKEIAERAGVGVGTIYRNFPTKGDLLAEMLREALAAMMAAVDAAEQEEDALDGLRLALTRLYQMVEDMGWLADAIVSDQIPASVKAELHRDPKSEEARGFHRIIAKGIRQGHLRPDLNVDLAVACVAGTIPPWNREAIRTTMTAEETADATIDLLLRGAANPNRTA
jgi:AcrR family transcriptional regulator